MRKLTAFLTLALLMTHGPVWAADLLTVGDPILAIDVDPPAPQSSYPGGEEPFNALDDIDATKYLNFGKEGTGLIITPLVNPGPRVVQSMMFRTANDSVERDPASWELYGTNDTIVSGDNSDGNAENWTLMSSGAANLPNPRFTDGPLYTFPNSDMYTSYKVIFPTVKNSGAANSMQIADILMYETDDGTGGTFLNFFDEALAVGPLRSQSDYPGLESPDNAIDGFSVTKYLNFGEENSGFIVTPSVGASIVEEFQITTADDFQERDPTTWKLYGTNDAIVSADNSDGSGENWVMIDEGSVVLPIDRRTDGPVVSVSNSTQYNSYRMVFPTIVDAAITDSMQIADIQFFGQIVDPGVDGDFNNDGGWDCTDVDALVAEIAAGTNDTAFDLTGDGSVNPDDLDAWLVEGGAMNPGATGGNPFLKGDANLDGSADVSDFNVWNGNKFTAIAAWCSGDFNADGSVDVSDFNIWNGNKFTSSSDGAAAVPEPTMGGLALLAAWGLLGLRRRKSV